MALRCQILGAVLAAPLAAAPGWAWCQDAMLMGAAYRSSDLSPLGPGLTSLQFVPGQGLVRWTGADAPPPSALRTPRPDLARLSNAGLSPYARFGAAGAGDRYLELGVSAPVRLSTRARVMQSLGIVPDGRSLDAPRWFLFAAAGGRALSYGYLQDQDSRGGVWALERGGFAGQAQVGVAWRQGDYQSSFSYFRQEISVDLYGADDVDEDRVAFTVTRFTGTPGRMTGGRPFTEKTALAPPN